MPSLPIRKCRRSYLSQLDTADRQEPTEALATKVTRLTEKLTKLKEEMGKLAVYEKQLLASPDQQITLTDPDSRSMAICRFGFERPPRGGFSFDP